MSIQYRWFGYKINRSLKRFLTGVFYVDDVGYVFHCAGKAGVPKIARLKQNRYRDDWDKVSAQADYGRIFIRTKYEKGYKDITVERVLSSWKDAIADIEMQLVIQKLKASRV